MTDWAMTRELSLLTQTLALGFVPHVQRPLEIAPLRHTVFPRLFSRGRFEEALSLTPVLHRLFDQVRRDVAWLLSSLLDAAAVDPFLHSLCELAREIYETSGKRVDERELFSFRTDYMTTDEERRILQVEINTISAGFACISEQLGLLHKLTVLKWGDVSMRTVSHFPVNKAGTSLAKALVHTHSSFPGVSDTREKRILFVVEELEKNEVDQRLLEIAVFQAGGVLVDRLTLTEAGRDLFVDERSGGWLVNSRSEVVYTVVYFRSGYAPEQYSASPSDCWLGRKKIEQSVAVKCPSLLTQLAGTKKVQQLLSKETVLKRFGVENEDERRRLMNVFAVQADPSKDKHIVAEAIANPDRFILKPQREGGGNNLYRGAVREALLTLTDQELAEYVLMERMQPGTSPTLATAGNADTGSLELKHIEKAVAELGLFSVYLAGSIDESCGHMVRTKDRTVDEGGVNAGFAYLDTVRFID